MKRAICMIMSGIMFISWPESVSQWVDKINPFTQSEEVTETSECGEIATTETEESFEGKDLLDQSVIDYYNENLVFDVMDNIETEDIKDISISAQGYSKEYLENLEYNSKCNIYFGKTQEELEAECGENGFVFTVGESGDTEVVPIEKYDDSYSQMIKNVAIGSGVILFCVTASVATGGAGFTTLNMIFAASAQSGAIMAASSAAIAEIITTTIETYKTKDFNKAIKTGTLAASDEFKWGAIVGAVTGGVSKAKKIIEFENSIKGFSEWQRAELRAEKYYGGKTQLSFFNGKQVSYGCEGATRPDIVRKVGDNLEAIEVKCYSLDNEKSLNTLYKELEREVSARNIHMPEGTTQRVVLDVTGKGYSKEVIYNAKKGIWDTLKDIYPNIKIDVIGR